LQGDYANIEVTNEYDAKFKIDKLTDLRMLIKNIL
jgi:hypothetical protein